jgi:chorismate-pyruvate lyase
LQALLSCTSATSVIEAEFGAPVTIRRLKLSAPPDTPHLWRLQALSGESVLHRRVVLLARGATISEADLWYVPSRLPPDMARTLQSSDLPFGAVIAALAPRRETIAARQGDPGDPVCLDIAALLHGRDGQPLALVLERYCRL